jgi:hypothetical protein
MVAGRIHTHLKLGVVENGNTFKALSHILVFASCSSSALYHHRIPSKYYILLLFKGN